MDNINMCLNIQWRTFVKKMYFIFAVIHFYGKSIYLYNNEKSL